MAKGVKFKDLLRDELPKDVLERIPRSFYVVGDIALISLDEDIARRYGSAIAEAIMRLHPSIKAVYARGPRVGVERVTPLIHLGGERRTLAIHKEYGVRILVDIASTYFNPALGEEHRRVAQLVEDGYGVADLFTGVGPFALHIAKLRHCYVIAIDVNPRAVELLSKSIKMNRLRGVVDPIHGDSIHMLKQGCFRSQFDAVIMNLPHVAHELVPYALKIVKERGVLHVYTVARSAEEAVEKVCSSEPRARVLEVRRVLDYAPRKYIYRVTLSRA